MTGPPVAYVRSHYTTFYKPTTADPGSKKNETGIAPHPFELPTFRSVRMEGTRSADVPKTTGEWVGE